MARSGEFELQVRPRKIAILGVIAAVFVVVTMTIVGFNLVLDEETMRRDGVYFRTADAVSLVLLGVLVAGAILLVARPRLRIDADGVRVRNVFTERRVPWALVERMAFPEGSQWAQLEMADDELMSVMAIQAMDKQRAVNSLKQVRVLFEKYAPQPVRVPRELPPEPPRELGRLEKIDRAMAAQGKPRKPLT